MSPMSAEFKQIDVDGQIVQIPTISELREIAQQSYFMGAPVHLRSEPAPRLLAFVADHQSEFSLGLYRPGAMKGWIVLPLFRDHEVWRRVQIERISCECCLGEVAIANPIEPSLYFGTPNYPEALRKASVFEQVMCPQCGSKLQRPAIWAELSSRKDENV